MPTSQTPDPLPHNLEAERALLGSVLLDESALDIITKLVSKFDFYSEAHRIIFAKMLSLHDKGQAIDLVTLSEELSKDGLIEKAGGAAYQAAITDGVPFGTTSHIPEYCRIVKEKATARRFIQHSQNVIARAMAGNVDTASLIEFTKSEIIDIETDSAATPKPEKKEAEGKTKKSKPEGRYPIIPPSAWHGAAELYRQAVHFSSEASDNWHFISFYTTLGALLGSSCYAQMGSRVYPNLYSVLVGMVGGDGKSTAVNFAFDFARMIDDSIYIPNTVDSKAGFIKAWATFNSNQEIAKDNTRAILRLGELASLLDTAAQTGTHSIIPMLNDAYDAQPLINESVATPFRVETPRLSAIFASAYKYLHKMDSKDLETGFGRRMCFCPGDAKGPMPYPDAPDQGMLSSLAVQIKDVLTYWTLRDNHKLKLSPKAMKLWTTWYRQYKGRLKSDDVISAMTVGDRVTCQKIALMNAALDKSEQFIEPHHLEPALQFGEYLYESRYPLFSEHGASPNLDIEKKILDRIPDAPARILKRALQQTCHIDSKTFNDRLHYLSMTGGEVTIKEISGRTWVCKKAFDENQI